MTLGHPVEGSQQVAGEKGMNVCLQTCRHMPIHTHGQIASQTLYHVSSQSLTEKTLLKDLNASHIEDN